ncbi:MAG TPA: hypothetical protein VF787_03360 [Thermoanaerobaculia bacterium]
MRQQPDIECVGGPYDGSFVPTFTPQQLVGVQFERSIVFHVYERTREDDGTFFYLYVGARERAEKTAAA